MPHIQIITGSTRPARKSRDIAQWVFDIANQRSDASFELIDIADHNLHLLSEPESAFLSQEYAQEQTKRWAATVAKADGFIFVTPEYNVSVPGALKNAIDHLYWEWTNKAVGYVGYGTMGGSRAIEHLRTIAAELQMADVRETLNLSLHDDFKDYIIFRPTDRHARKLHQVIDQVIAWSQALAVVRK